MTARTVNANTCRISNRITQFDGLASESLLRAETSATELGSHTSACQGRTGGAHRVQRRDRMGARPKDIINSRRRCYIMFWGICSWYPCTSIIALFSRIDRSNQWMGKGDRPKTVTMQCAQAEHVVSIASKLIMKRAALGDPCTYLATDTSNASETFVDGQRGRPNPIILPSQQNCVTCLFMSASASHLVHCESRKHLFEYIHWRKRQVDHLNSKSMSE